MSNQGSPGFDIRHADRYVWMLFDYTGEGAPITYLIEYAMFDADGLVVCMMVPGHKYRLELPETTALAEHRIEVGDLVHTHVL
jgi:hypothetical protein